MLPEKVRIVFVMPDMELGGVEKSLISLLDAIGDQKEFYITLLLFKKSGVLLNNIPSWVEIKEISGGGKLDALREKTANFLAKAGFQTLFYIFKRLYHFWGSNINFFEKKITFQYDIAIAYKDGATTWFTAKNIIAKVKIAFVHTDFVNAGYNSVQEEKVYENFDRIYCASVAAKESFVRLLPNLSSKAFVFYDLVDRQYLRYLAKEGPPFPDDFKGTRILTVGRLSREKGLDKAIQVLQELKSGGYQVRWYAVGKGREEKNLRKLAAKFHVKEDFIFLGEQNNPYRMLSDCDIYVQPSNYEGYCIALAEARILCRPIVACNFAGAREQIRHGVTGIITEIMPEALCEGIKALLINDNLREQIIENLNKNENYLMEDQIDELIDYLTEGIK